MNKRFQLPERYLDPWKERFDSLVGHRLFPGAQILDVGGGRNPAIPRNCRPPGTYYVGLDLSMEELKKAPAASYDEIVEENVVNHLPSLTGKFDIIISWQVLEHVKPLDIALENIRSYLRPEGILVAQLSGTFSAFGILNKVLPQKFGVLAMRTLLARSPETVFPAYYDHCSYSALFRLMSQWKELEVIPDYKGAAYFNFSLYLRAIYLIYENWAFRGNYSNLATHYLIVARK